jgi:tetratricopeptide (TPR) repeat protein
MKKIIVLTFGIALFSGLSHGSISTDLSKTYSSIKKWLQPQSQTALQQGHEYFKQGNHTKAKLSYQQHLESKRRDSEAWHHLALSHLATGSPDQASLAVNTAIAIHPHSDYKTTLARLQIYGGEVLDARESLNAIVANDPSHPTAWLLLGRCHESMGTVQKAKVCYQKALEADPNCDEADRRLFTLNNKEDHLPSPHQQGVLLGLKPKKPVPKSRLFNETHKLPADNPVGLCQLIDSYHVSKDAPDRGLVPTEVIIWEPNNALEQDSQTKRSTTNPNHGDFMPPLPYPKTKLKLDDL